MTTGTERVWKPCILQTELHFYGLVDVRDISDNPNIKPVFVLNEATSAVWDCDRYDVTIYVSCDPNAVIMCCHLYFLLRNAITERNEVCFFISKIRN
jgi:hypothetical protein